jgi:hypothetical protein
MRRRTDDGSKTTARTNPSAPSTAIPSNRNGKRKSQTIGYRTSAARASGQQSTTRMSHNKNFVISDLLLL